jgi:hypothetical protein
MVLLLPVYDTAQWRKSPSSFTDKPIEGKRQRIAKQGKSGSANWTSPQLPIYGALCDDQLRIFTMLKRRADLKTTRSSLRVTSLQIRKALSWWSTCVNFPVFQLRMLCTTYDPFVTSSIKFREYPHVVSRSYRYWRDYIRPVANCASLESASHIQPSGYYTRRNYVELNWDMS